MNEKSKFSGSHWVLAFDSHLNLRILREDQTLDRRLLLCETV